MGRPDFSSVRPRDQSITANNYTTFRDSETVSDSSDENFVEAGDDLAGVSTDIVVLRASVNFRDPGAGSATVWFFSKDSGGNIIHSDYSSVPDGVPMTYDPGIPVPEGGSVFLFVRQETGSDQDMRASIAYDTGP